jgi:CheY-like chemotaxis protein
MNESKCIMVVDDDPDLLEQMCETMTHDGFQVVAAGGHDEASEKLLSVRPDLAIVDLMMERSDSGFALCHELKSLDPRTPVITSARATREHVPGRGPMRCSTSRFAQRCCSTKSTDCSAGCLPRGEWRRGNDDAEHHGQCEPCERGLARDPRGR